MHAAPVPKDSTRFFARNPADPKTGSRKLLLLLLSPGLEGLESGEVPKAHARLWIPCTKLIPAGGLCMNTPAPSLQVEACLHSHNCPGDYFYY